MPDDLLPILATVSVLVIALVAPVLLLLRVTRRLSPKHRILRVAIVSLPPILTLGILAMLSTLTLSEKSGPPRNHIPSPSPGPPIAMPLFPWPPPRPSTRVLIPRAVFIKYGTFGQLSSAMDEALARTGYAERSYYAVPGGIGIITRLEHIYQDGRPFESSARWLFDDSYLQSFSLRSYLGALFTAREGYYRVIVFTVTDVPFGSGDGSLTSEQAASLLARGYNTLPEDVAARELPAQYACTSLVYEFLREQGKDPTQLVPGHLDAKAHLVASGLWATLESLPYEM
jgi:hypothetical protein